MAIKQIENREDVKLLVRTFYTRVQEDELIGPIFRNHIHDWEAHFELLTDFWYSNLFFKRSYFGNPVKVHQQVDQKTNGALSQAHFFRWIQLWIHTVDGLFEGKLAQLAKHRARKMATFLFVHIVEGRKKPI